MHSIFIAPLLLTGLAYASPSLRAHPPDAPSSHFAIDEPLFAAPTRLDGIGRIMAPVMIDGRGPFRFIVDTGANYSVITTRLAAELGLQLTAEHTVKLNGVTGSAILPTVMVDRLQTGDLVQRALQLPVLDSVMSGAEGILGMQGFEGKRITVDFKQDFISIARSRNQEAGPRFSIIPAQLRFERLMVVNGKVAGINVKAVIDTGAQRTLGNLALRDALLRRKKLKGTSTFTQVIGLTSAEQRGEYIASPPIELGAVTIADVHVTYGEIEVFHLWDLEQRPALLIGMDVLGTLRTLVIDYRRRELQILP
jgi:predicted aspartyl protease